MKKLVVLIIFLLLIPNLVRGGKWLVCDSQREGDRKGNYICCKIGSDYRWMYGSCPPTTTTTTTTSTTTTTIKYIIEIFTSTTTTTIKTTTTTTIPPSLCDFDGICEAGETQVNCNEDCKTEVEIIDIGLGEYDDWFEPGEKVKVVIKFSDSRFTVLRNVTFDLYFDYKEWDVWEECFRYVTFSPKKGKHSCYCHEDKCKCDRPVGQGQGECEDWEHAWETVVEAKDYYFKIEAYCNLPEDIEPGSHIVQAVPKLLGSEVLLKPGEARFYVGPTNLLEWIISFFAKITNLLRGT